MINRAYRSSKKRRDDARKRREKLEAVGLCINTSLPNHLRSRTGKGNTPKPPHGPPEPGKTKCRRCLDVQRGKPFELEAAA